MKQNLITRLYKYVKSIWENLNRSIYVGDRLTSNMRALTLVSVVTTVLGLVLTVINISTHQTVMLIASVITSLAGIACAYCSAIIKNRELAEMIPTLFCAIAFTIYALTGAAEGSAILWSLLLPIGLSYFVSVKYGIILSVYYSILYMIIFYTPFKEIISGYYTEGFMQRFPLLFIFLSIFTCSAMIQYHRTSLFEIEHTNKLTEEVARQTAVAEERSRRIEQMSLQTIQTLANAIDAKDPYTKGHSTRVSQYSVIIAEKLGWSRDRIDDLRFAALLHDIGKIGVPDSILNNPRKLTDVEYSIIKSHSSMGGEILKNRTLVKMAEDVARSHHERYDGHGYPAGLKGTEISEEARIVAISDAFDAMSSSRVYRKACDPEHIRNELIKGKGNQFDPEYTDVFLNAWETGLFDEIKKNDSVTDGTELEESSALLQEVMETFVTQSAVDDIDITTGIMTRTAGETVIAQAMKLDEGCFVFFDVDNLKKINDTQGHETGDELLKLVGDTLKENIKDNLCCRLGGDEFLLFLRKVSKAQAESEVKRIINEFDSKKNSDPKLSVASLSAGMVMCTPSDTYMKVYSNADKALYHVKQNGKNSFGFYDSDSEAVRNEELNMNRLVNGLKTSGSYEGAMGVEYREFTKLYELVANIEKRFSCPFKLIVITLETVNGDAPDVNELEKAMFYMEQSIHQTIRGVDILTRYSSQQFLILLLGADDTGVTSAVDRIFRGYYKMNVSGAFSPSYTVADSQDI